MRFAAIGNPFTICRFVMIKVLTVPVRISDNHACSVSTLHTDKCVVCSKNCKSEVRFIGAPDGMASVDVDDFAYRCPNVPSCQGWAKVSLIVSSARSITLPHELD